MRLVLELNGGTVLVVSYLQNHISTVPIFNSCTKCVGSTGIVNDRMLDC